MKARTNTFCRRSSSTEIVYNAEDSKQAPFHILFPNLPKTPKMDHELIKLVNKLQDTFNNLGAQFDFSGISGNKL